MYLIHVCIKSATLLPGGDSPYSLLLSMKNSCGLNTYGFPTVAQPLISPQ